MGKISQGILGGFSGTVGTVVGGNWRGIDYMRSRPKASSKPKTQKQLDQQEKFKIVTKFVQTFSALTNITYKDYAVNKTGRNSCISYLLKNAIAGVSPLFYINYREVLISKGGLPGAEGATVASSAAGRLVFNWTNNADDFTKAKASDRAIVLVHCSELNLTSYTISGALRSAGTQTYDIPRFAGREVQVYMSFISQDGKEISDSLYMGQVTVL